jgi:hypothetical protein
MKLPPMKKYPTDLHIGDETYTVKFVTKFPGCKRDEGVCGLTDSSTHTIYIMKGMSKAQTFRTLVHEVLHGIEFEYDLKIRHSLVYQLEKAIGDFLLMNF